MKIIRTIPKAITAFLLIVFSHTLLTGCRDFEEYNTDPTKSESIDPNSQLSYAQLTTYGDWVLQQLPIFYLTGFVQHMQGDWQVTHYGGVYRKSNHEFQQFWTSIYGNSLKNMVDVIHRTEDDPLYQNVRAVCRIFRVYYAMMITDVMGDIPYFEAGRGYIDGIIQPAYDRQEDIYKDFLKELKEVEASLDDTADSVTGDIIYGGSIMKWRRFANSLRLRAAMRLTKVEPELAKSEVKEIMALASGVFISSADDAVISYMDMLDWESNEIRRNGWAQMVCGRETYPKPYLCTTFWNYMKDTNDPRLLMYGRCYDEDTPDEPFRRADLTQTVLNSPAGMDQMQPILPGYYWWENWPSEFWSEEHQKTFDKASRPQVNNSFLRGSAPGIILSYAEVQLLLSEAVARWGSEIPNTRSAADHYKEGVTAAMMLLDNFPDMIPLTNVQIEEFFDANPFPSATQDQLKVINEQLWIHHFINPCEAYANWRRSGYPELKSAKEYKALTIDSETIPRRLNYPMFEASYNKKGYDSAIERLGGSDDWNQRVWWDKE